MKKFVTFGVIAISVLSLLGCPPTDLPPDPPEEKVAHVDYPDWNENKVDDREETLTPKDRVELFSILDYQKEHEDKGWMVESIDVSKVKLSATPIYDEEGYIIGVSDRLFEERKKFNQDISNWDVSNVTDMMYLFLELREFNQDISKWDVSQVTDMRGMFADDSNFDQDLEWWDISNVENMKDMFFGTPMEYKPHQHPKGCKCGATSDPGDYGTNPYPEYGTWSHAAE